MQGFGEIVKNGTHYFIRVQDESARVCISGLGGVSLSFCTHTRELLEFARDGTGYTHDGITFSKDHEIAAFTFNEEAAIYMCDYDSLAIAIKAAFENSLYEWKD